MRFFFKIGFTGRLLYRLVLRLSLVTYCKVRGLISISSSSIWSLYGFRWIGSFWSNNRSRSDSDTLLFLPRQVDCFLVLLMPFDPWISRCFNQKRPVEGGMLISCFL